MYSVYYREEELNMNIDNAKYLDKIEKIQKVLDIDKQS